MATKTIDIVFQAPPGTTARGGPVAGSTPLGIWLAALRDHPGKWAKWPYICSAANVTNIRQGKHYGIAKGEYEATWRRDPITTNRGTLYARYIGPVS